MRVGFVLRVTEIKPLLYRFVEITSFYTILFRFHPPCGMVLLVLSNRTRGGFLLLERLWGECNQWLDGKPWSFESGREEKCHLVRG